MCRLREIIAVVFLLLVLPAAAQKKQIDQQNENIRRARAELAEIERLRKRNSANISASERDLTLARNQIGERKKVVREIDGQIVVASSQIAADSTRVGELGNDLHNLKTEYAAWVRAAWIGRKMNTATAFLLAARDFNDATRRLNYIRRYNLARAAKGAQIDSLARSLDAKIDSLDASRSALGHLRAERTTELSRLAENERAYNSLLDELRKDGKSLEARAKKEREKITAAQRQINRIMAEQAREEKARAAKTGGLSAADSALSGDFEAGKGRMPWPVGGPATVLHHFGTQKMSDGIVFNFDGIFIAASSGAGINSVFAGRVTKIYNVDQFGRFVIIRSGHYMVVYGNLGEVNVSVGSQVALGQRIGNLVETSDPEGQKLMFQIWNETAPLDPEEWLRR